MLFVNIQDGRCADADDILPDGFHIRKGDEVNYVSYAMGRMPYIWGNDAEDFRPERWLKDGIFQPESPFKFIAFHVCIKPPYLVTPKLVVIVEALPFLGSNIAKRSFSKMLSLVET